MTDYKQLCVELLSELENAIRVIHAEDGTRHISGAYPVINKVKNTLTEPEPEEPTDDDLWDIGERHLWTGTDESATNDRILTSFIEAAHVVLARLGNHQGRLASSMPQPIPASERLPEMDDCDADGRCWVGYPVTKEMEDEDLNPSWELCQINPDDEYWLPANALPVPS